MSSTSPGTLPGTTSGQLGCREARRGELPGPRLPLSHERVDGALPPACVLPLVPVQQREM